MDQVQKDQIDQAVQELRKAFHWRAELCAKIAKVIAGATEHHFEIDSRTREVKLTDLPYQHEAEQLEQVNELISRLMHQILQVSMTSSVYEWDQRRNEVIAAERLVALHRLNLLTPVMLDLGSLPFDPL